MCQGAILKMSKKRISKYLLVFGAGASFGSDVGDTSPLTKHLFEKLASFNPGDWGNLSSTWKKLFRRDFENGMKTLSERKPHTLPPLQRAMAAFFFNFVPKQSNFYTKLAKRVKNQNWNGAIATFNYERLLELSYSI